MGEAAAAAAEDIQKGTAVVVPAPRPSKGVASWAVDLLERLVVRLGHDKTKPLHWLSGNFAPVQDETPPAAGLPVRGHLPECLNGEFVRVGPNPKFVPVAGYHWFDGDGMIHAMRIKDGKATYVSRYVKTSRLKQEEYFGGAKFMKIGDLKGFFGLFMVQMQELRKKLKVLDATYGIGTANTAFVYHHGKLMALSEADKPYVVKVLEDGDLQTLGLLDYDKRLKHSFTAHPKVDPLTDEMFTFGYSHEPPYCTYRVITKDGVMLDPVPITIPESVMMHDFAITENYSIFMDLPLMFRPKEMVKNGEFIYKFDPTKKARFGILQRYEKDEKSIRWFELPNCFIFHNANAWEEGDEVVLITCRVENPDLDKVNGEQNEKLENFGNELYEMRFNMKTGAASQKQLSVSARGIHTFPDIACLFFDRRSHQKKIRTKVGVLKLIYESVLVCIHQFNFKCDSFVYILAARTAGVIRTHGFPLNYTSDTTAAYSFLIELHHDSRSEKPMDHPHRMKVWLISNRVSALLCRDRWSGKWWTCMDVSALCSSSSSALPLAWCHALCGVDGCVH